MSREKDRNRWRKRKCSGHVHYSGFGAGFPETRRQHLELQFTKRVMANPVGHVVLGEEEAQQAAERYAKMEAELQAL